MSKVKHSIPQAITVPALRRRKEEGPKIVMLTAYDFPTARIAEDAGADVLLVGDSLGMVVQGKQDTLGVTLDQMLYHCSMVSRASRRTLVVADMPFMTYQTGWMDALRNCGRCLKEGGVHAVKIEGGKHRSSLIKRLVRNGIPVMGHIGLTPQSLHSLGGFKIQGKTSRSAEKLIEDAKAVEKAGAFSIVLECIPAEVASEITGCVSIPTIGIGAGASCDGQVLVFHDLLGLYEDLLPRFVRRYGNFGTEMKKALEKFKEDVLSGDFPKDDEAFHLSETESKAFNSLRRTNESTAAD